MQTTATADFVCSKCKKGYAWYADFAGKVARCTCGAVIQFPFTDPKPKDPLAIPFLPRNIEEQSGSQGPAPMELPKDDLDPKILAERRALGEYFDDAPVPVDPVRDVHGPLVLLALGGVLMGWHVLDMLEANGGGRLTIRALRLDMGLELLLSVLAVMFVGRLMGFHVGKWKIASYKMSAIYLAPRMISSLIAIGMGDDAIGRVVGSGAAIILCWAFFTFIFRTKPWQSMIAVACISVVCYGVGSLMGVINTLFYGHPIQTLF